LHGSRTVACMAPTKLKKQPSKAKKSPAKPKKPADPLLGHAVPEVTGSEADYQRFLPQVRARMPLGLPPCRADINLAYRW
jgi:hypothetical protein